MSGDKRARLKEWLASGEIRLQPLTFPQRELWEASAVPVADPSNHICCLIFVRGAITENDCRSAIRQVIERQEALRLSFLPGKDGALQMIRRSGDVNLRFRALSAEESSPEAVEEIAREVFREPFDLMQGPLYRVAVLQRAPDDHVLVLAIHHSIADGWTLGVFVRDLCSAYLQDMLGRREPLPAVPQTCSAWAAAERAFWQPAELAQRAEYWKTVLADAPRLWAPRTEAPASYALQRSVLLLPADLGNAARELARRGGATLFSTLLTVFQVALSKWTGANDLVVGTPVANRHKPAVRETMGYISGNVPLRVQLDDSRAFLETLRAVHETTMDAFANAMPFAELARALGEMPAPGRNPIYDVRFALQNHPIPDVAFTGLSAKLRMRSTGTARFELGCEVTEQGEALEVVWLRRPDRFSDADVATLDRLFQAVLSEACRAPEICLATLKRQIST